MPCKASRTSRLHSLYVVNGLRSLGQPRHTYLSSVQSLQDYQEGRDVTVNNGVAPRSNEISSPSLFLVTNGVAIGGTGQTFQLHCMNSEISEMLCNRES
jgi:hypothetical protein